MAGAVFSMVLAASGFFLNVGAAVTALLSYAVLSLAGCALLCTAVYRLTLRYALELTAEGALPPAADLHHVVTAEGLVNRGALGWHPWVNRHGYVIAGQRLREFGIRYPGRATALYWAGALLCAATVTLLLVWPENPLPPTHLLFPAFGGLVSAFTAVSHRSVSEHQKGYAEAFREKYEAWGATGDPYFPGFPERGPGRAGPAPARRVTPPGARR
ncbi:hypothetical protein [Nocardiopsis sp. NPDC057823]|uniref:hypothetical protein n=1 Tax=Nocardiopsis sp. NPDC057823 TaxID=3346256 RepID=UPI00366A6F44